ncbi:MAG: protein kinase, partial [Planctomycetes bacterium]|nr:protein kinase [Planctomycetota bacterium]
DEGEGEGAGRSPQLGRYRILHLLGEGGFGTVHLAEQYEPVHRQVALKVLRAGMDTAQVIERFKLERESLAMMSHPNIAQIYDAGTTDAGLPFFAMEFVDGLSLTPYCDSRRLGLTHRLQLFVQVCRGVHHAHQKGIIHRDLKPSNVLVATIDGAPVPKIIDFGIAKATLGLGDERLAEFRTLEGKCIGTPGYMSPEQADLTGGHVDVRSDVYSLGVLLYELLTGRLPHDPTELRERGLLGYLQRVREVEARRPSTTVTGQDDAIANTRGVSAATLRHRLRGDLDWITLRALERDPTRRYQSADDIAEDLERHLRHEPVLAGPPGLAYRARKFVRRHRVVAASSVAVLLALVFGLIATLWQYGIATDNLRAAVGHRLSAQAINLAAESPTLALLLAIEGAERAPGEDADAALYTTLGLAHEVRHEILHDATIRWAARSRDETCSLSADDTHLVLCLDLPAGTIRHAFDVHEAVLSGLAVDATGDRGASFDLDGLLLVLDLRSGRVLTRLPHDEPIVAAAFLADQEDLVTIDGGGALRRIDARGAEVELARHPGPLRAMAVTADGRRVAVLRDDGVVALHELPSGRALWQQHLTAPGREAAALSPPTLAFTDDGHWLACLNRDGGVTVLDPGDPTRAWQPTRAPCSAIALASAAGRLALFDGDGPGEVVDLRDRSVVRLEPTGLHPVVAHAAIDPGAYTLVTVLKNRPQMAVFDPQLGTFLATLRGDNHALYRPHVSADGEWIDAYGHNGAVHRWRTAVLDEDRRTAQRGAAGKSVRTVLVPPGDRVIEQTPDHRVVLTDVGHGREVRTLAADVPDQPYLSLSPRSEAALLDLGGKTAIVPLDGGPPRFCADTALVKPRTNAAMTHLVGMNGTRVLCFDTRSGARVFDKELPATQYVDVDAAGTTLVTADGGSNHSTLWSLATGEPLRELSHRAFAFDALFGAAGDQVLTLANDSAATVWDVATGRPVRHLKAPTADFGWLHRDPAGRYVAVHTPEETSIYSLEDGQRRLRWAPNRPELGLVQMSFTTGGESLLVKLANGSQRLLPLDPLAAAKVAAPRQLTAAERERFELPASDAPPARPRASHLYVDVAIGLLRDAPGRAEIDRAAQLLDDAQHLRPRMQPRFHLARALLQLRRGPLDAAALDQVLADLDICLRSGDISGRTLASHEAFAPLRADERGAQFVAAAQR